LSTSAQRFLSSSNDANKISPKDWQDWYKKKRVINQNLITAAELGELQNVQSLLVEGQAKGLAAEVNCTGLDQWTPLHFAANEGHLEIVDLLLAQKDITVDPVSKLRRTPFHLASIRGNTEVLRKLHKAGADTNLSDHEGNTALHFSSENGHAKNLIFLLKEAEGVNFRARNNLGMTPQDIC
jgi:ankyrin repeat protein